MCDVITAGSQLVPWLRLVPVYASRRFNRCLLARTANYQRRLLPRILRRASEQCTAALASGTLQLVLGSD